MKGPDCPGGPEAPPSSKARPCAGRPCACPRGPRRRRSLIGPRLPRSGGWGPTDRPPGHVNPRTPGHRDPRGGRPAHLVSPWFRGAGPRSGDPPVPVRGRFRPGAGGAPDLPPGGHTGPGPAAARGELGTWEGPLSPTHVVLAGSCTTPRLRPGRRFHLRGRPPAATQGPAPAGRPRPSIKGCPREDWESPSSPGRPQPRATSPMEAVRGPNGPRTAFAAQWAGRPRGRGDPGPSGAPPPREGKKRPCCRGAINPSCGQSGGNPGWTVPLPPPARGGNRVARTTFWPGGDGIEKNAPAPRPAHRPSPGTVVGPTPVGEPTS